MTASNTFPVIIIGAGGHANVVIDTLREMGMEIYGILTPDLSKGDICHGVKVLGGDDDIGAYPNSKYVLANGIGMLPNINIREKLAKRFRAEGYEFVTLVHPKSIISKSVAIADGAQVMAGSVCQPDVKIGKDTIINTSVSVDHDCVIGDSCHVAPGAVLCGEVIVGNNVFIGSGVVITQGVTIGDNSIVAAGSIVHKDVAANTKVIQKRATM